jgi:hypothetical protein
LFIIFFRDNTRKTASSPQDVGEAVGTIPIN